MGLRTDMREKRFLSKRLMAALAAVFIVALQASNVNVFALRPVLRQALSPNAQPGSGPVIRIDKQDYLAGETVQISGSGFAPYEKVMVRVAHDNGDLDTGMGHEPGF